jgi:hypothetical protein
VGPSKIESHWNDLGTLERVKLILQYTDHFLSLGLVTPQEIQEVAMTSESEWEYIIDREEQPLFQNINIKKEIGTQNLRSQLKAALAAAFS